MHVACGDWGNWQLCGFCSLRVLLSRARLDGLAAWHDLTSLLHLYAAARASQPAALARECEEEIACVARLKAYFVAEQQKRKATRRPSSLTKRDVDRIFTPSSTRNGFAGAQHHMPRAGGGRIAAIACKRVETANLVSLLPFPVPYTAASLLWPCA